MERKILLFLKKWLINQGDCCPKNELDFFIVDNFKENARDEAITFVNQLINKKWMQPIIKDGRVFIAVSGYGAEKLKKII